MLLQKLFVLPPTLYKLAPKYALSLAHSEVQTEHYLPFRANSPFIFAVFFFVVTTFAHLRFSRQCHFHAAHQINTVILLRQTLKSAIDYLWRHAVLIKQIHLRCHGESV